MAAAIAEASMPSITRTGSSSIGRPQPLSRSERPSGVDTAGTTRTATRPDGVERVSGRGATAPVATPSSPRGARPVALRTLTPIAAGVELSRDGLVVDGKPSSRDAGVTRGSVGVLYEAARRLTTDDGRAFRSLEPAQQERLRDQLLPFLLHGRDDRARAASVSVKARASAFALLHELCLSMKATGKARGELANALVSAAHQESHPALRRQMTLGLEGLPARALSSSSVKVRESLLAELAPPAPPYAKWFGAKGKPEFRVRQYIMDEFWREELAGYRKQGFEVQELSGGRAVATKLLEDPNGKHPPVLARVEIEQREHGIFDAVSDPKIHAVIYSGHSQLGAVGKIAAEHAPMVRGEKFIGMFACRTKQNLPALRREFPGAQLLVSDRGTYGHDDRIVMSALFDGIARRAGWAEMERDAEKRGPWEKNNYIFPHDKEQWHHVDHDGDGAVDISGARRDVLLDLDVRSRRRESISFKPLRKVPELSTLDARKVVDAVAWFNTEFTYWSDDFGTREEKQRADRFRADGFFRADDASEVVRVVRSGGDDPVWRVQVNAAYSHLDADALAMMVTHELAQHVTRETRPKESEHERRMRSLAMVSAYVNYHVEFSDQADHLLRRFAERFGYPQTLSWPVVEKAVASDNHAEASDKVVRMLEKGMQYPFLEVNPTRSSLAFRTEVQKALDVLRESKTPVARTAFEAIVSGRVKVDCLSDLTRADFLRVRKELLPVGVDLDVDDFMKLHDEKSGAMRAITSSLDGYMWDDRVYIAQGRPARELAATLVHEVNHVLNKSEENYRTPRDVLREEYRAVYCEEWLKTGKQPSKTRCRELKEEVITNYALQDVTPSDVPDLPPGLLTA